MCVSDPNVQYEMEFWYLIQINSSCWWDRQSFVEWVTGIAQMQKLKHPPCLFWHFGLSLLEKVFLTFSHVLAEPVCLNVLLVVVALFGCPVQNWYSGWTIILNMRGSRQSSRVWMGRTQIITFSEDHSSVKQSSIWWGLDVCGMLLWWCFSHNF